MFKCSGCDQNLCQKCESSQSCQTCRKLYCKSCTGKIQKCSSIHCNSYACCGLQECISCRKSNCKNHTATCSKCLNFFCRDTCKTRCGSNDCSKDICKGCAEELRKCSFCNVLECHSTFQNCTHCSGLVCENCKVHCTRCNVLFCKKTKMTRSKNNTNYCEECCTHVNLLENRYDDLLSFLSKGMTQKNHLVNSSLSILPYVKIKDMVLSYPCTETICEELKKFCILETQDNHEDRNYYEISKDIIQISDEFNNVTNNSLSKVIGDHLCPEEKTCFVEFEKLLLFEKGSTYKPDISIQRSQNHFGTLLIFLPSYYEGGEFIIQHLNYKKTFSNPLKDENFTQEMRCNWVSFFTDCQHELLEVKSGYRVALCYKVLTEGKKIEPPKESFQTKLLFFMDKVFNHVDFKHRKVGYILTESYSEYPSRPEFLKGSDLILYKLISTSEKYLVKLRELHVHGTGGYSQHFYISKRNQVYYINESKVSIGELVKNMKPMNGYGHIIRYGVLEIFRKKRKRTTNEEIIFSVEDYDVELSDNESSNLRNVRRMDDVMNIPNFEDDSDEGEEDEDERDEDDEDNEDSDEEDSDEEDY